jgi:hypothetical protein
VRRLGGLLAIPLFLTIVFAGGAALDYEYARAGDPPPGTVRIEGPRKTFGHGLIRIGGKGAEAWRWEYVKAVRRLNWHAERLRQARRELRQRHEASSLEAIALASVAYGVDHNTLIRKARCETGGTFSPYAKNPNSTASGLFQFLTSTWASTPYGHLSIWDPYANALAAGWMHARGRGGEWVCR